MQVGAASDPFAVIQALAGGRAGRATTARTPASSVPGTGAAKTDAETTREKTRLQARDQAVRAHEAAHVAAGGSHIRGAASFTYETGPDGKQYAIGGEVQIDVAPVAGNPRATIAKMLTVRAAALAPGDPSSADLAVAAAAQQAEAEARKELAAQVNEEAAKAYAAGASTGAAGREGGREPGGSRFEAAA